MNERQFQFEWNEGKAAANLRERFLEIAGFLPSPIWSTAISDRNAEMTTIRLISAGGATENEARQYQESIRSGKHSPETRAKRTLLRPGGGCGSFWWVGGRNRPLRSNAT